MKKSLSQYRLLTGIRSHRPNPIIINRQKPEEIEAAAPESSPEAFQAVLFDKDYAFHYVESRWFRRELQLGEPITITVAQLKMICDECHEMGRLRERNLTNSCDSVL